jgi:hypothetical protein
LHDERMVTSERDINRYLSVFNFFLYGCMST